MILERDDQRREREQLYRRELLSQIHNKKQKNRSRIIDQPPQQSFSLIKNIEAEQQKRKNKQKQYYEELQQQRLDEIRRKKEEKKRKQQEELQEQRKLQLENQQIRRRYEEQKRRESEKKTTQQAEPQIYIPKKKQEPKFIDQIDLLKENSQEILHQQFPENNIQPPKYNSSLPYQTRIQNQDFNFVPKRKFHDNYYRQLLYENRKFDENVKLISEFNRFLNKQKLKPKRSVGRGIEDLRQLDKMLQEQSQKYMSNAYEEKITKLSKRNKTHQPYSQPRYDYFDKY